MKFTILCTKSDDALAILFQKFLLVEMGVFVQPIVDARQAKTISKGFSDVVCIAENSERQQICFTVFSLVDFINDLGMRPC